jgi:hypothetical protein
MSRKLIVCLAFAALVSTAWGYGYTYVNANTTNTVSDYADPWWKTTGNDSIELWRYRSGFGMAEGGVIPGNCSTVITTGEIYQARDSWGDTTGLDWPTLKTTVTGLDDTKTYNLYVVFWIDEHNSPWRIRAAMTEAGLASSLYIGGEPCPTGPFRPFKAGKDSAGRIMYVAQVATVFGETEATMYIDDEPNDNSNCRAWYDGIAYREVPEPMTIALLGLGGLLLKRRKH